MVLNRLLPGVPNLKIQFADYVLLIFLALVRLLYLLFALFRYYHET